MDAPLVSARLALPPLSSEAIQALIDGDATRLEALTGAVFPRPVEAPPLMGDALPFFRDRLREDPASAPWWVRLLIRRGTGEAVGSAGLTGPPDEAGTVTLGYAIYPVFQGAGYATEAAAAIAAWALAQPGVVAVRATVPPGNLPSLRVVAKAGFRRLGAAPDDEAGEVEVWELRSPADRSGFGGDR